MILITLKYHVRLLRYAIIHVSNTKHVDTICTGSRVQGSMEKKSFKAHTWQNLWLLTGIKPNDSKEPLVYKAVN